MKILDVCRAIIQFGLDRCLGYGLSGYRCFSAFSRLRWQDWALCPLAFGDLLFLARAKKSRQKKRARSTQPQNATHTRVSATLRGASCGTLQVHTPGCPGALRVNAIAGAAPLRNGVQRSYPKSEGAGTDVVSLGCKAQKHDIPPGSCRPFTRWPLVFLGLASLLDGSRLCL